MAALVVGPTLSLKAQDVFTNGLVAYYPFAGNANDVWGGLDGTVFGTLIPSADRFGQPGQALHFDGATYVEVPDSAEIQLNAMTFSVWVELDHPRDIMNLLNKDDFFAGYQLFVSGANVIFSVGDGSGTDPGTRLREMGEMGS